jgi:cold shock CspA family protein
MNENLGTTEGRIVRVLEQAGYAFVRLAGDPSDIYLHKSRLRGTWPPPFNARVRFELERTSRGMRAQRAEIIEEHTGGLA